MRKLTLAIFVVLAVVTSISASAAQVRTSSDGRSLPAAQNGANERGRAIEVAPPNVATLGDDTAVDILVRLDPWSGASSAYKLCPAEKDKATCQKRCKCGYDENVKKCDNAVLCLQVAIAEKEACDIHCETDYN
jgi:hypothetical protein